MVAKKKNAAEGEIPKPKTGAWGKPTTAQEEIEFDPSRVAGIISGKSGAQLAAASTGDEPTLEANADTAGWEPPFRDGYKPDNEDGLSQSQHEETVAAAKKKPARAKNRAPVTQPQQKSSNGELTALVERVERLMEEGAAIRSDIKEVMGEAKSGGFDTATIRRVIAYRAKDPEKLAEQEALFDTYFNAVGGR